MLKIKKEILDNRYLPKEMFRIIDTLQKEEFEIFYMENGDLYFSTFCLNKKNIEFIINRSDFELYRVFNNLFMYFDDKERIERYDSKYMKDTMYNKEKKTIKVSSDDLADYNSNVGNELLITKKKDNFKVVFINKSKTRNVCGIRFNTDRSIYGNLIFLFTNLHKELEELYNSYQIDVNDYMILKKIRKEI